MNLQEIFDKQAQNKAIQATNYQITLKDKWQRYFNGVEDIIKNLEFLSLRGFVITKDNYHEYNFNKAVNGYYPCVRLNHTTMIYKYEDDFIKVCSLHGFALTGEQHTYESFVKKLVTCF